MANRKSLKAYNVFISGWVRTIYHLDISDNENIVINADITPAQCVSATPYVPWVALSKMQGIVLCAHCSCMAGLEETCRHVAGLLFKIEAVNRT